MRRPEYVVIDRRLREVDSRGSTIQRLLGSARTVRIVDESSRGMWSFAPRQLKTYVADRMSKYDASPSNPADAHRIFDDIPGWPRILVDVVALDAAEPLVLIAVLEDGREVVSETKLAEFGLTPRGGSGRKATGVTTAPPQIADEFESLEDVEAPLDHIYRKTGLTTGQR